MNNRTKSWREYFENINEKKQNFKLFIETAYGCHGSCGGCPIPQDLRNSKEPKIYLEDLSENLENFSKNLLNFRKSLNFPNVENLAITIGPGENLYFSSSYLERLAILSKKIAKSISVKNFHLAVTTSGLFSENKVEDKLIALSKNLDRSELSFAFILNPRQFIKTPNIYYNFAKLLFKYSDLVELEINMDNQIHLLTEEEVKRFCNFINAFNFIQLDFAYAINIGNMSKTYFTQTQFLNFIEKLRSLTFNNEREFFSQWNRNLKVFPSEDFDYKEGFNLNFENIISSHIRLNTMGEWHFAKNILGTIYYDQTYDFEPVCFSKDNPYSSENILKFKRKLTYHYNSILTKHKPCLDCLYKNACLSSGFMSYARFSDKNEEVCSNPGFSIFEKLSIN